MYIIRSCGTDSITTLLAISELTTTACDEQSLPRHGLNQIDEVLQALEKEAFA
jgi:hypothetical protein